jgi:hypothetical protein
VEERQLAVQRRSWCDQRRAQRVSADNQLHAGAVQGSRDLSRELWIPIEYL